MFSNPAQMPSRTRSRVRSILDTRCEQIAVKKLALADVRVDGSRPSDLLVHNPAFYTCLLYTSDAADDASSV